MKNIRSFNLGMMFRREHAPEHLPEFSRRVEATGFDEVWVVEDCFYGSGLASAATALACTESITVGLGIMPAVARNPVFTAMEIATLARLYPGRFLPGLGHGVAGWMRQIGAFPKSQLNALEEVTFAIHEILTGKSFTFHGKHVQIDQAKLVHPPDQVPPISLGVIGAKSLAISGRVADGTILSEYAAPVYVSWAREQIAKAKLATGPDREHRLTVFAIACAASDAAAARQKLRPMLASAIAGRDMDAKLAPLGILPQVHDYLNRGGQASLEANMPDEWIDQLAIVGTPQDWKIAIHRLVEAGAQSVVLVPLPDSSLNEVEIFANQVLS